MPSDGAKGIPQSRENKIKKNNTLTQLEKIN